jgi:hypothetical protein
MVERAGALGYFGDARRAAVGTELLERVTATGSLVIRKLGETRAGELAMHRFLAAPSVTCGEMLETLAGRTMAAARPIAAGLDRPAMGFRPVSSSIPWSPSTVRRKLFSVFSTRISGPATTRSRRRHAASAPLRTRRASAGSEGSSGPLNY